MSVYHICAEKIGFAKRPCNFQDNTENVIKIYVSVRFRPGGQLADTAPVLGTGGKPSTWLPPGRLVEHLPVAANARKSNTGAISASWPPGRKRTQT